MHQFHYRKGILHCEEVNLQALAEEHGTPLYVYSAQTFRDNYHRLTQALEGLEFLFGELRLVRLILSSLFRYIATAVSNGTSQSQTFLN